MLQETSGLFEDFVRTSKQVYYDNDQVKTNPNVKREAALYDGDGDTDAEDAPPPPSKRRSRSRNVCVTPP